MSSEDFMTLWRTRKMVVTAGPDISAQMYPTCNSQADFKKINTFNSDTTSADYDA